MPIYSISGPDGRIYSIEGPPDATREQVIQAIQERLEPPKPVETVAPTVPVERPPATERTAGEAVKDIGASLIRGAGALLEAPGQLVQLVPGLQTVGETLTIPGEALSKYGESLKSQGLRVREALRSQALSEAEKDGILAEFGTAITSTIKDPALISTFFAEQLPLLLGPGLAARAARVLGAGRVAALPAEEAAAKLGQYQTRAAIGAGAGMQAADISSDTYKQAYQIAINQGKSPEQANAEALNAARLAAAGAGVASVGVTAGLSRLGGATVEKALAGVPGTSRIKGLFGEAGSEALEESAGQLFSNVGLRTVDPNQSLTQGVGTAAGLGALGGAFFGTLLAKPTQPELAPGQQPGETLYDTANRLNAEIQSFNRLIADADKDAQRQQVGLKTSTELVDMYRDEGYGAVKQYQITLEERAKDSELPKEERDATKDLANDIGKFLTQVTQEELARKRVSAPPTNVLTDSDVRVQLGFSGDDPLYERLVGKNIGIPDQAQDVLLALDEALERKGLRQSQRERIEVAKTTVNEYLSTIPGSGFYAPITEPSREGAGVAGVSGERPAAARPVTSEPIGLVRPTEDVGPSVGREEGKPAPVAPKEVISKEAPAVSVPPAAPGEAPAPAATPKVLPADLKGAKPRYAYGPKQFQVEFESDVDKALFITAQKTPSKRDADYRKWLVSQGYTQQQIAQGGTQVRNVLKNIAKTADPKAGPITLPTQITAKPKLSLKPGTEARAAEILGELEAEPEVTEEAPVEAAPKTEKEQLIERRAEVIAQFEGVLNRILAKYGLKGVKLDLQEAFENEGSYARQIITLALNVDNPVRVLRHESIHALKDMGFFTDAQWNTLVKRANDEWIGVLKNTKHDAKRSRYDAYVDLFTEEAQKQGLNEEQTKKYIEDSIVEEAIADAFGAFDVAKPPPGLMNAILNRMRNLFKVVKEAFNIAGIESAEDIFGKIEEGKLKPTLEIVAPVEAKKAEEPEVEEPAITEEEVAKPEKLSLRVMKEEVTPDLKGKVTVDRVGKYFDDQIQSDFGRTLDYDNPEDFERAVKEADQEVDYQLQQENSGLDWYEDDVKRAFEYTAEVIPEINNIDNRVLFSVIAGIMSPQVVARDNWYIAAKAFKHYIDTNTIPGVNPSNGKLWQGGTQSANKKIQLEFLDRMIKDLGQTKTLEWLTSDHTVKEINAFRAKYGNLSSGISGKASDIRPGLYAFGPKIGPFVANLNGIHDVTVDKWMTRTFNRYFGTMIGNDGTITDAPTEPQRRAIKELVNRVAKNANIKPYQVQSLLWFYEQRLFTKVGALSPSYGFSDGGQKLLDESRRGGTESVPVTTKADEGAIKQSLRAPETPQFKFWFGQSKIVDKDGKPQVMYHGTARDISEFVPKQAGAIFVTDDPEFAASFADMSANWMGQHADQFLSPEQLEAGKKAAIAKIKADYNKGDVLRQKFIDAIEGRNDEFKQDALEYLGKEYKQMMPSGPNLIPVYVKAENPFDYENEAHVKRIASAVAKAANVAEGSPIHLRDMRLIKSGSWRELEQPAIQKAIRELGFDGFYVKEGGRRNLAVYNPNQLKSVFNEAPTERPELSLSLRSRWSDERINDLVDQYSYKRDGRENDTKAYAAFVSPQDFLNATASKEMMGMLREEVGKLDIQRLAQQSPMHLVIQPLPDGRYQIRDHEGRHRMMMLADAGYTKEIPVVLQYGYDSSVKNAKDINNIVLRGQRNGRVYLKSFTIDKAIPISWNNRNVIKETFGGEADIKFSLRSLVSNAMTPNVKATINKIAPPRYDPTIWERVLDTISGDTYTKIRSGMINRWERLAEYDRRVAKMIEAAGGVQQLADRKAESAALFSDLGAGLLESALGANDRYGGAPVFRKGVTVISNQNGRIKGPILIFKPLADLKDPEAFRLYQVWAAVKRGIRLDAEGRENLIDAPDVAAIQAMEKTNPTLIKLFEKVQKDWITYNDALIKFMVDTGVITKDMASSWTEHGDYFPFYRLVEEDVQGPRGFRSLGNVKQPKALKGGENPLGDFFENIVRNSKAAIEAGIKNVAAQRATDQALTLQEVTRLPKKESGINVYRVLENGKEVYYRSHDPLFIDAIKTLNMPDLPFIGLLAGPANILRNLVTKDPAFMLANMMRDSLSAYTTSGVKMTPIIDTAKNFAMAIANRSPETRQLYAAGVLGGYDYSRTITQSARQFEKKLREVSGTKTTAEKLATPFTSLWGALEKGTQASDAATRVEVYKRVLKETGNEAEAYWQALEVMNFNRRGSSPVIRVLTAAIPFLNARMQGLDLLYRTAIYPSSSSAPQAAKERMKTFWVRGMTMFALSSMYWALTHDDDEYKNQEQETRDNYWLIPSLGIKIPIPFEVGVMFKVIPERIMGLTFGDDTNKDFTESMKRQFTSTFGFNFIPQVFLPGVEVATNHSFFTQRPIIGKGLEDVAPAYQIGPSTSKIAQMIGESVGYSPIKVDHLIKGYTGTMGAYAVDLMDMMFEMTGDSPKASKRFEQMPVVRRFALDPEARGTVTAYYGLKDAVDEAVRTSNLLERSMNYEDYGKYMTENIRVLASKDYINALEKDMKEFREMKNIIRSSQMSADEKRDSLLAIGKMEQALTNNIQVIKKSVQ